MYFKIAAVVASLAAVPVCAQDIGGTYSSVGRDPAGGSFSGRVEITMLSDTACTVKWSDGSSGICLREGSILAISYLIHGELGLEVLRIAPDGSMEGPLIDNYHGGGISEVSKVGTEALTPAS